MSKKNPPTDPAAPEAPADAQGSMLRLKAVAFLCGASLMGLEMAGVRLIEPHFGSTIYVWGSIIGIFMGALSVGYWMGGRLADKHPRMPVLGYIILLSALFMFVIPWAAPLLCRALNGITEMPVKLRTLIGGVALYALPSICLGMVSPFAVRLAARKLTAVGTVAGSLYAISTLGSIVGTFFVSFVLVEFLGSSAIVWSIAVLLVLVASACILTRVSGTGAAAVAVGLLAMLPSYAHAFDPNANVIIRHPADSEKGTDPETEQPLAADGLPADTIHEATESVYHNIAIVESRNYLVDEDFDRRERAMYMRFNNQTESGIVLRPDGSHTDEPAETACGYVRLLHLGLLFTQKAPERVLIIGGGGGVGPQMFAHDYKDTIQRIDVVDIDPVVFEMAYKYFRYPRDTEQEVIRSHVEDGRRFIGGANETWDTIIMDAYSTGGRIPRHLISKEFFELVKTRLTDDGVVVCNVISALKPRDDGRDYSRLYRSVFKTLTAVFGENAVAVFPRSEEHYGTDATRNIILVATRTPPATRLTSTVLRQRYYDLHDKKILKQDLRAAVGNVRPLPPKTDDVPLLTDDFCPTDSMVAE